MLIFSLACHLVREEERFGECSETLCCAHWQAYPVQCSICNPWIKCYSWAQNRTNQPKSFSLLDSLSIPLPPFKCISSRPVSKTNIVQTKKLSQSVLEKNPADVELPWPVGGMSSKRFTWMDLSWGTVFNKITVYALHVDTFSPYRASVEQHFHMLILDFGLRGLKAKIFLV